MQADCAVERPQDHVGRPVPHVVGAVAFLRESREPAGISRTGRTVVEVAQVAEDRRFPPADVCPDDGDPFPTETLFQRQEFAPGIPSGT